MKYKLLRFSLLCILTMLCGGSVWADTETKWVKVDPTELTTGDSVIIVDQTTSTAMANNNGASSEPTATAITLNSAKDEITAGITDALKWKVTIATTKVSNVDTRSYKFSTGSDSLYCISNNNGVRVGNGANNAFIWISDANNSNSKEPFLFNTGQSRYIGVNGGSGWRCYTSINNNIKATVTAIYKKVEAAADTRVETKIEFAAGYQTWGAPSTYASLPTATVKTADGTTTINGAEITWASSDEAVASISDASVSFIDYGKATITATYAGDATTYKGSTKSYEVTVRGATEDGIFNFGIYNDYGSGAVVDGNAYITEGKTWTAGNVTLVTNGKYRWYTDGSLRIYNPDEGSTTLKISVPEGKVISQIVLTGSSFGDLTASTGSYESGTWTGSAQEVTLTRGNNNSQIKTITVSYQSEDAPESPTFAPAAGTFYGTQNVTLSTTTDGATIYYSLNESTDVSLYYGPIEVSETTTIHAYAEKDDAKSATVSATYTIRPVYTTVAQLQDNVTGANTPIGFQPESIQVVYVNGKNGYLVDNAGNGVLVYNGGGLKINDETDLAAGQVLTGGMIRGSLVSYQGSTEISGFTTVGTTISTADVVPVEKTLPLTTANQSTLVTVKGLTYTAEGSTFSDGTNTVAYYDKFKATPTLEDGKKYDVTAIAVKYDNAIQLCPRTAADIVESTEEETVGFRDIKANLTQLQELATGSNVYITVDAEGNIGTTDDATKAAATLNGGWHGTQYGWTNFTASVPVEGCVKITYATHDYGNDITVTNSDNEQVAKFNTNGAKWSNNPNNVVVAYYRTNEPTTLNFSKAQYNPYFAVEAIDEADLPAEITVYNITFAKGDDVTGTVPAAIEVNAGDKAKAPVNSTLYKEGYTLIGWESGNEVILPGAEFTPEADMTLTAKFGQNEVSLNDREDAVTITYALDGYNDNPKHNFQSGAGMIVTQATVNGKTIDVAANTNGKFAHNGSGWHQVNAGTTVTVPACKDAVITISGYAAGYTLTVDDNAMTDNGDKTYSYTVPADATSAVIANAGTGGIYWNSLVITLPKVEEEQGGGDEVTGVFFSADVIATAAQNFSTGTTEITSEQATIVGGKMYAISAQADPKALINKQGSVYYFTMTNNNTYFKVELDNALAAGDVITADALGGVKNDLNKGLWITTSDGYPASAPACAGTSATESIVENILNYTVAEGDGYVGATTLYIYRSAGATEYFGNFKITRPDADPNAVATPVITPATGTYSKAQEVTIACETEGATIYYTTDGNDPTAESTEYTAAFTVSETTTVKAIAINGEYSSDIAESVITISSIQPGESNLEWDYTETAPTANPDDGLYYKDSVNDQAGTNMGLKGIKLDSSGYAWFAKNPVEGKLTLTIGQRKSDAAYAVNVYACTIDGATATKGNLIGEIAVEEGPGTGSLDIPASVTGIYIERKTSSEGVISKIVFKEKIARTFVDFEMTNDELKGTYDTSKLPSGVTFSGTPHNDSHGYQNATITVPTDGGAVKFTIGGCQYDNPATFTVKNSDNETLATLNGQTPGCYHNGGIVTYIYSGDATTLTFGPIAYLPYFKAEAVEVSEATITYKDQNGDELGKKTVFEGDAIGEVPYTEADLTIEDGYAFRGWIYSSGVKVKATDIVDGNKSVFASVTAIETDPTAGSIQNYDLTSAIFYPEDHENFDVADATYYNNHGWNFAAGGSFSVKVAEKAQIVLTLCEYGSGTTITVTDADNNVIAENVPAKAESGKDGSTTTVNYNGGTATTLTFTFAAQSYLHKVSVFNVNEFVEKDETSGYYIVPKDDAAGLVLAINAASSEANSKVFLPNGTYDLGTTALTTISGTNVSIIGESMEGVVIKNRPEIEGISITATLLNTSTGLYLQDLTLDCEAPWGSNGTNAERGVTLQDKGTQTICKNVYLKGRQDTYYCNNSNGQFYFEDGKIEGTVDYICGNGDAYFQNVTLFNAEHHNPSTGDCITAPNTPKEYGYIFNECTIDGVANQAGKYSLGRPWAANTQVIYLHTRMNILPIAAGWTDWTPANAVKQFAEFHSYDPNNGDADVDLSARKTTFAGGTNVPVLTETEAAAFKLSNVFAGWNPKASTQQVAATNVEINNNTITWTAAEGATMYAIVKNGSIIDFTDQTTYTIDEQAQGAKGLGTTTDNPTAATDTYAVRAANARGGFGDAVEAEKVTDGINTITIDATGINGTITEVYSLNGARLAAPQQGVNIMKVKTNDGSVKTMKVVIK